MAVSIRRRGALPSNRRRLCRGDAPTQRLRKQGAEEGTSGRRPHRTRGRVATTRSSQRNRIASSADPSAGTHLVCRNATDPAALTAITAAAVVGVITRPQLHRRATTPFRNAAPRPAYQPGRHTTADGSLGTRSPWPARDWAPQRHIASRHRRCRHHCGRPRPGSLRATIVGREDCPLGSVTGDGPADARRGNRRSALAQCPGAVPWRSALAQCPGAVPWRLAGGQGTAVNGRRLGRKRRRLRSWRLRWRPPPALPPDQVSAFSVRQ